MYPASGAGYDPDYQQRIESTIKQSAQKGKIKLYVPGNAETDFMDHRDCGYFPIPAPAFYSYDVFSLDAYQEHVYQQLKGSLEHADKVYALGCSMGGAALVLAASRLKEEDLKGKSVEIEIVDTFSALPKTMANHSFLLLLGSLLLCLLFTPLHLPSAILSELIRSFYEMPILGLFLGRVLADLFTKSHSFKSVLTHLAAVCFRLLYPVVKLVSEILKASFEVIKVLILYPVLFTTIISCKVLRLFAVFDGVKSVLDNIANKAKYCIAKYLADKVNSAQDVSKALENMSNQLSITVSQAQNDTVIPAPARLIAEEKMPKHINVDKYDGEHMECTPGLLCAVD
ncbi:hypothetical protein OAT84_00680 [Gammaproteobacteria bacterium]|nr:hypothetical protein [Gammaproteobacteria bacterium]